MKLNSVMMKILRFLKVVLWSSKIECSYLEEFMMKEGFSESPILTWVKIHYWCTALMWEIVKMPIVDWLPNPPPLYINIGFGLRLICHVPIVRNKSVLWKANFWSNKMLTHKEIRATISLHKWWMLKSRWPWSFALLQLWQPKGNFPNPIKTQLYRN